MRTDEQQCLSMKTIEADVASRSFGKLQKHVTYRIYSRISRKIYV